MMRRGTVFTLILAFAAFGCERTHFAEEIQAIDSLITELDSAEMIHRRIDTTGFSESGRKFSENLAFVQKTYTDRQDTMSKDVAMLMSDYRTLKKPSKGFSGKYRQVHEEIKFSKNQLRDLSHDLQNNLLDSSLVQEMLGEEKQAIEKMMQTVNELKVSSEYTRKKRAQLEPQIDSLVQVLKQENP